jgi:hypothetical protein
MRKLLLGVAGATALIMASAASATITVTGSTNLNSPDPCSAGCPTTNNPPAVVTTGGTTTISYGTNPTTSGAFTGSFTFTNTLTGLYSIVVGTSTPGATITAASLTGISGTVGTYNLSPLPSAQPSLAPTIIAAGNYMFSFTGIGPNDANGIPLTSVVNGNVSISAVPEPGTWALMILGFGAIGMTMRRKRQPALAQLA